MPTHDPRRLVVPDNISIDGGAYELLSAWATNGKVSVMTRTGTGLDQRPEIWGEILIGIAENIAVSLQEVTGAEAAATLQTIKVALDRRWPGTTVSVGKHFPA